MSRLVITARTGHCTPMRILAIPPRAVALVADDEALLRMEAADILADAGYAVLEAHDAATALALLRDHPGVRLLLTDIRMPGALDGLALAHRACAHDPDMAVIVCSAHGAPCADALPARARFIEKPYSARVLYRTMNACGAACGGM